MRKGLGDSIFYIALALLILGIDFASKEYVVDHFLTYAHNPWSYPYAGWGLFEDFYGIQLAVVHTYNKGTAWGLFAGHQDLLQIFRLFLLVGLFVYILFLNKKRSHLLPLTMIFAGAFGNVIDYYHYGAVVDMIKVVLWGYHYPVFNIADSAITIGIVLLSIQFLFEGKRTHALSSQ